MSEGNKLSHCICDKCKDTGIEECSEGHDSQWIWNHRQCECIPVLTPIQARDLAIALNITTAALEQILASLESRLEQIRSRSRMPTSSFYQQGLDYDGVPNNLGNADDVYEDGFDAGVYQGEYDLATKLLNLLGGKG